MAAATAAATADTNTTTGSSSGGGRGGHHHDRPVISPIQPNQDQDEALATAQSILSAAEITLPSGDLAQGVYDALGNYYSLPEWIVSDPLNVVDAADLPPATDEDEDEDEDDDVLVRDAKRNVYVAASSSPADEDQSDHGHGQGRRRGEKGKGVEPAAREDTISVRCRLSENARDVVVTIGKNDSVKSLARKVLAEAGVSSPLTPPNPSKFPHPAPGYDPTSACVSCFKLTVGHLPPHPLATELLAHPHSVPRQDPPRPRAAGLPGVEGRPRAQCAGIPPLLARPTA